MVKALCLLCGVLHHPVSQSFNLKVKHGAEPTLTLELFILLFPSSSAPTLPAPAPSLEKSYLSPV